MAQASYKPVTSVVRYTPQFVKYKKRNEAPVKNSATQRASMTEKRVVRMVINLKVELKQHLLQQ